MSWRDTLRPASFRGVEFSVDATDATLGRRLVEHEYPLRNSGYVEDLGRGLRRFSLAAFLIGDDYPQRLQALLIALEGEGPGELVHPLWGTMQVSCAAITVTESSDEGRMATLSLAFIEPGELEFPTPTILPQSALASAADAANAAISIDFASSLNLDGPAWVEALAVTDLTAAVQQARQAAFGPGFDAADAAADVAAAFDDLNTALVQLVRAPADLAARWQAAFALFGDWAALLRIAPPRRQVTAATPAAEQAETNATAIAAMVRRSALVAAASALTEAAFFTSVDTEDALAAITAALLPEEEALSQVRIAAVLYLQRTALGLPGLRPYTPPEIQPSFVVAYDLYADPRRSEEIDARNVIEHPAFALGPLQVLTL